MSPSLFSSLRDRLSSRDVDYIFPATELFSFNITFCFQSLGYADGYDVSFVRDVRRNPELANDLENVRFVEKRGRKKRRPDS